MNDTCKEYLSKGLYCVNEIFTFLAAKIELFKAQRIFARMKTDLSHVVNLESIFTNIISEIPSTY